MVERIRLVNKKPEKVERRYLGSSLLNETEKRARHARIDELWQSGHIDELSGLPDFLNRCLWDCSDH